MKFRYKMEFPADMKLQIDENKFLRKVANEVAKDFRGKLKSGTRFDGGSLPKGKDNGRPLWDSGETVRSIKARKRRGKPATVQPEGYRSDRPGKPHALVANSLAKQHRQTDLFGTASEKARKIIQAIAAKFINKWREDKDFRLKVVRKTKKTKR